MTNRIENPILPRPTTLADAEAYFKEKYGYEELYTKLILLSPPDPTTRERTMHIMYHPEGTRLRSDITIKLILANENPADSGFWLAIPGSLNFSGTCRTLLPDIVYPGQNPNVMIIIPKMESEVDGGSEGQVLEGKNMAVIREHIEKLTIIKTTDGVEKVVPIIY